MKKQSYTNSAAMWEEMSAQYYWLETIEKRLTKLERSEQ